MDDNNSSDDDSMDGSKIDGVKLKDDNENKTLSRNKKLNTIRELLLRYPKLPIRSEDVLTAKIKSLTDEQLDIVITNLKYDLVSHEQPFIKNLIYWMSYLLDSFFDLPGLAEESSSDVQLIKNVGTIASPLLVDMPEAANAVINYSGHVARAYKKRRIELHSSNELHQPSDTIVNSGKESVRKDNVNGKNSK